MYEVDSNGKEGDELGSGVTLLSTELVDENASGTEEQQSVIELKYFSVVVGIVISLSEE